MTSEEYQALAERHMREGRLSVAKLELALAALARDLEKRGGEA